MSQPTPRIPALVLLACGVVAGSLQGCAKDTPDDQAFSTADTAAPADSGAVGDAVAAADTGDPDSAGNSAGDSAAAADTGPTGNADADAGTPGKLCGEVLKCVLTAKSWKPGKPVPKDTTCTKGVVGQEATDLDALLGCADKGCVKEVDAWDKGGDAQLPALYACLIDNCANPLAVCVGGQGKGNCGDALKCLNKCTPTDRACTLPCMENTTGAQAIKAGAFLQCVLDGCGGLAKLPACDIPLTCGLKCPEVAG